MTNSCQRYGIVPSCAGVCRAYNSLSLSLSYSVLMFVSLLLVDFSLRCLLGLIVFAVLVNNDFMIVFTLPSIIELGLFVLSFASRL